MVANLRTCGSRSKTGCRTCKLRRVKCDESKPHCQRCQSAQRVCTYTPSKKPPRPGLRMVIYTAPQASASLAGARTGCPQTQEALNFFVHEARGRLFPVEFCHAVLRASQSEAVLGHAICAFGALQRVYEFGEGRTCTSPGPGDGGGGGVRGGIEATNSAMRFATREYGKALGMLRARRQEERQSHDVALVCSVLFACFECLRGCRRAAIIHIASGLNLLRQMEMEGSAWDVVSRRVIRALFTRLDSQLVEVLGVGVGETLGEDGIRTPGAMVMGEDAGPGEGDLREDLDELMNAILREKLDSVMGAQVSGGRSASGKLLSALETWHARFANAESDPERSSQMKEDDAVLRIWYLVGKMYLTIRPSDPETAWDQFSDEFETILGLCEIYISESKRTSTPRNYTFSFSLGIVPPLFITAQRCRNASIRRRAIHLLSTCRRREIVWDSAYAAEAAQRVMEIEESAAFDAATRQPADLRVRTLKAILDDEDGVKVLFE
ncbi:hypothetical protein P170DRAFT_391185 [Aspergillus steynii IBT 23096]|uniref:Zn(2)-C6 fungal-type domain-containing protein n=1 Tax=Aspergillus steynii IBT 23096 TaxID=1392250 RepID=A0A2I2FVY8_9EURO|nr:uncharacterized protein P170DRAFT_391185 [Aspergillus steynii IBT 23096]PLB44802.1 hypothetical protein P170DRAFT_391185 [Aspergillus steynii IBT 23096]